MHIDAALPADFQVDVRSLATGAEQAGFDGIWTTEIKHDPFTAMTLAAVSTKEIAIGTGIAVAFARSPMITAVQANDLQELSQGRLLLGLGSQIKAHITRRFAMPWSHPAPRMREYVQALHAIWGCWQDGSKLDFQGEFYNHTLMPPFFSPGPNAYGPPKVLLAGVGQAMTAVAGEVCDGLLCHGFTTERYLREVTLPALVKGRQQGRGTASLDGFDIIGCPFVVTGRNHQEFAASKAGVQSQIAFYASTPAYRGVLALHGWEGIAEELHTLSTTNRWGEMGSLITDEMLDAFAIVGEPDQLGPALARRYGDVFTRATLYMPWDIELASAIEIAMKVKSAVGSPSTE